LDFGFGLEEQIIPDLAAKAGALNVKENHREAHLASLQPNELWHSHFIQLSLQKRFRDFETQQMMSKVFGQAAQNVQHHEIFFAQKEHIPS
jgi:hypothetical protein